MERVVTKSQFSRMLGVSGPRLSVFIGQGLPVRSLDYKIDVGGACRWIVDSVLPWGPDRPCVAHRRAREIVWDLEHGGEADEDDAPDPA
jgi:hypothetical protein